VSNPPLGIIGLGLLGGAMSERLIAAGHKLLGYDVNSDRRSEFAALGGHVAESSVIVAQQCPHVLLSLPDSAIVQAVLAEIGPQLAADQLLIDTTTGDPANSLAVANQLATRDIQFVDATIVGSSTQVRQQDCIVLAGGTVASVAAAADICSAFARHVFHVGTSGSGAQMKLVVNLVLGLNRAVLAEGLSFATSLGLDATMALEILSASAAYSRVMDTKGQKMLTQDFTPQARLAQHAKDVQLILSSGKQAAAQLPLSTVHAELLAELLARGFGDRDNSAIIAAFDRHPGDPS